MTTTVATANLLFRLPAQAAAESLQLVLAEQPDLIGLQEWYVPRIGLLRATGEVTVAPGRVRVPALRQAQGPGSTGPGGRGSAYHWVATLGAGCVAGARADRYDLIGSRAVLLSGLGTSERADHPFNLEPPRIAAVAVLRDRTTSGTVALVSYHFVSGVETRGRYRSDRPRLVARHQRELRRAEDLVTELQHAGHTVYAVGDANFALLPLGDLSSAWAGREHLPGTIGRGKRKIDDVHGPEPARSVRLVTTQSDHRALIAEFD